MNSILTEQQKIANEREHNRRKRGLYGAFITETLQEIVECGWENDRLGAFKIINRTVLLGVAIGIIIGVWATTLFCVLLASNFGPI